MIDGADIPGLISQHGLWILAPLSVLEGPIITVIAAYLAQQQLLVLWQVVVCVIIGDLVGDALHYAAGRGMLGWLPARWQQRLGITPERIAEMAKLFEAKGMRVLVVGKLTHAVGFAALIGAGAARMRFGPFLLANLLASVPKSLVFIAIGYLFGEAHEAIGQWLTIVSAVVLGLAAGGALIWLRRRRARS